MSEIRMNGGIKRILIFYSNWNLQQIQLEKNWEIPL